VTDAETLVEMTAAPPSASTSGSTTSGSTTATNEGHALELASAGTSTEEGSDSAAAARFKSLAASLLSPGVKSTFGNLIKAALNSGVLSDSTIPKNIRGNMTRSWLASDPRFEQWQDPPGNFWVMLKTPEQLQPSQVSVAEEMQLVVGQDGTASLVPARGGGSKASIGQPASALLPSDADTESFLKLLPDR
jgi:hypothetical protein